MCFSEFFIYVTYDLEVSYGADLRTREFGLVNQPTFSFVEINSALAA